VFDPFHKLSSEDELLARDLVALLRGRDTEFATPHPDKGPGTFEHARVHLWAAMTLERLGDTLQDEDPPGTRCTTNEWQRCDDQVHELLEPLGLASVEDIETTKALPVCTCTIKTRPGLDRIVRDADLLHALIPNTIPHAPMQYVNVIRTSRLCTVTSISPALCCSMSSWVLNRIPGCIM